MHWASKTVPLFLTRGHFVTSCFKGYNPHTVNNIHILLCWLVWCFFGGFFITKLIEVATVFPVCWQCSCVVHNSTSFSRLCIFQVHKQLTGFCLFQGKRGNKTEIAKKMLNFQVIIRKSKNQPNRKD